MSSALGGLGGTLNGMEVLSRMEALRKQAEEEMARRAQEATQQAGAAQQAYGAAAAAPPPQLDPMAVFLPTLIGNVASVIARDPGFRERAQQGIQQERESLVQSRLQNLQALRENSRTLAERAEQAGDAESAAKYRGKMELLSKQLDTIEQKEKNRFTAEQNRLDREAAEKRAKIAAGAGGFGVAGGPGSPVVTMANQLARGEIDWSSIPADYKPGVSAYLAQTNLRIVPKKVRDTLVELSAGRVALNRIGELSSKINTADWRKRFAQGARATTGGALQKNPDVTTFNAMRRGLLAALSRATGERGVLTNQDVQRARELLPSVWDSKDVAQKKLAEFEAFFNEKEQAARGAYFSSEEAAIGPGTPNQDPLGIR